MSANAKLMRCFCNEVYNLRNVEFLRAHLHPEVVGHGPGIEDRVEGIEQVVGFSEYVYEVYEDYHLEVNDVVADGVMTVMISTTGS